MKDDLEKPQKPSNDNFRLAARQGHSLIIAFHGITDDGVRQSVVNLVEAICKANKRK